MSQARAVAFTAPGHVEIIDLPANAPEAGECLVAMRYSCISPGTELRCLRGQQAGNPGFPFVPGYAACGVVVAAGRQSRFAEGARVYCHGEPRRLGVASCWGRHGSHLVFADAGLLDLPDAVDDLHGCALKLAATPWHGLRRSLAQPHERVAVVGLGLIGQLAARCYDLIGCAVAATDPAPKRAALARAVGIHVVAPAARLEDAFTDIFPAGAEVVVDCTGNAKILSHAAGIARELPWGDHDDAGPRLVVQGSYAGDIVLDYATAFLREMTVIIPRADQLRDMVAVRDLVARGRLRFTDLLADIRPADTAPAAYHELATSPDAPPTIILDWAPRRGGLAADSTLIPFGAPVVGA